MPAKLIQFYTWDGIEMVIKVIGLPKAPSVPNSDMEQPFANSDPK